MWRHKNSSFLNYGIGLLIQKEQDEKKKASPKMSLLVQNSGEI